MDFITSDDNEHEIPYRYKTMHFSKFNLNNNMAQAVLSATTAAKKMANNVVVPESNSETVQNPKPSVNYRLIHHLYVHYKSSADKIQSCQSFWSVIAHDYNLVLSTNYSATEIEIFWNRMPAMDKRKIDLQHYDNCNDLNVENNQPSDVSKRKKKSKKSSTNHNDGNKKLKTSTNQVQPIKVDKSCQVDMSSIQDNSLIDLAKEEYRLKIEILKIRLEFLQKQFRQIFPLV